MIVLPFPPTVNTYWRNVNGRTLLSAKGRAYRDSVAWAVAGKGARYGSQRISVEVIAYMPDARRRDLDNLFKGVLDGLAHAGVYDDDSQIDKLSIWRLGIDREDPRVTVDIMPL